MSNGRPSRITPTYMGNTKSQNGILPFWLDHPHIHGEYCGGNHSPISPQGSPPHTWGIHNGLRESAKSNRITPTYMGNTSSAVLSAAIFKDHPHIHGEYLFGQRPKLTRLGSPPHTWGIQTESHRLANDQWITPTYMGNTRPKHA